MKRSKRSLKERRKNFILVITIIGIVVAIIALQPKQIQVQKLAITANQSLDRTSILKEKEAKYPKAIELVNPDGYINTNGKNITIKELIGKKVIIVDFWTYSCINCIRTLPYLTSWYDKYKDAGLEIIGVHTPEFEFEKDYNNVQNAVQKFGVKYPVVQDNNYLTWRAYGNQYWPHKYLIDIDGYIVYDHIGEGGYDETEQVIQNLLSEKAQVLNESTTMNKSMATPSNVIPIDYLGVRTPEIYLGYQLIRGNFGNTEGIKPDSVVHYSIPNETKPLLVYLEGDWRNNPDNVELVSSTGKIILTYDAKAANIVASANNTVHVGALLDGKPHKVVDVSASQLYNVATADGYGMHRLELDVLNPGLKLYTFTFG